MPSVSPKQHRFMEMVAHNPGAAKRVGVPQKVGQDFADADAAKGNKMRRALKPLGQQPNRMADEEDAGP